jgi:pyrroline-5-carboxylate reductase
LGTNRVLGIIGCGNMGKAIISGILESSFLDAGDLLFFEKSEEKAAEIKSKYGIEQARDIMHITGICRYVLLAVKPVDIGEVLDSLEPYFEVGKNSLLSIAAGIPAEYIQKRLKKNASVIRIMPNTPALYRSGLSAISRGRFATEEDMEFAVKMMGSVGEYIVIEERLQNIATALNGSGPAYFFLFCKYMIEAGVEHGLEPDTARRMVIRTMVGAGITMERSGYGPDRLIKMVASPGGTTERALLEFEDKQLESIVKGAVKQALERARELEKLVD